MKGPNLSAWALAHASVMRFMIVLAAVAGAYAYFSLGRQEDPDFTIKNMLVAAEWPGASVHEVADQLAEPLERAVQTVPEVEYINTSIRPGRVVLTIKLWDTVRPDAIPGVWSRIRQRVGDRQAMLPEGVRGPQFNDYFGDTFGNIYALTGDGYSKVQLKDFADRLRDRFRQLPDVGRVEFEGEPEERIYIEYSTAKLASLGIDPRLIIQTLRDTNTLTGAGMIETRRERIRVDATGTFNTVEQIRDIGIVANGRSLRLGDIAVVERGLLDPPTFGMRVGGRDAVGVLVSLRKGGDVTRLGRESNALVSEFVASLPVGVQLHKVADQPAVVSHAINEFTHSLMEAVLIVLVVSFFSLGARPGIVVALSIPIVLALTFAAMFALGIPLHRVSLGALIIALGLLVDDAIIVIEQIDSHLHAGWRKALAVTSAYTVTAQPMLIGTLITMVGFLPIALANSAAGEYAQSIFQVVGLALGFSWVVAVFVTPFLADRLLREKPAADPLADGKSAAHGEASYDGPIYRRVRGLVGWCVKHRVVVIAVTAGMFVVAVGLFTWGVPKQFFPTSDRPELIVDLRTPQNASYAQTLEVTERLEAMLVRDSDVESVTAYVGGGTPRFYLSLDVQTPNIALAQLVVKARDEAARDRLQHRIQTALDTRFPEVRGRTSTLELGPPVGQSFKIRLTGTRYEDIAPAAERLELAMRADRHLRDVNANYGETLKTARVEIDQDKARALGVTSLDIKQALQGALQGTPVTRFRDGDSVLEVTARLGRDERMQLDHLPQISVPTASGAQVPLSQVARLAPGFELAELNRRSGVPTITVQADVVGAQAADVARALDKTISDVRADLPANAQLTLGGTIEESASSQGSVITMAPIALLTIMVLLLIQLQSNKKMVLVLMTGPLALIGVALILSLFRIPFGFVAMLGGLSLFGMVIRNSVILVSQIDSLTDQGQDLRTAIVEATVHRFRPIMLTALAAILAMIPLTRSVFWGPMAWAIMGGLMVATLLTILFLPAIYALAYGAAQDRNPEVSHV